MAQESKNKRNYAEEYLRRVQRGLARGKSRAAARGHARASDFGPRRLWQPVDKDNPLEKALKLIKTGVSQKQAAKLVGVSAEKLRRFQKLNTESRRAGRSWIIIDTRPVTMVMATQGKLRDVTVTHDASSDIGRHWVAINLFLETNDPSHLKPFTGKGLRDASGKLRPFETRPNILRKLDSIGELSFVDIYRQTVQQ